VEFNIAISKRFTEIRKWRALILFVKIPHPAESFISKNEGMTEQIGCFQDAVLALSEIRASRRDIPTDDAAPATTSQQTIADQVIE
jgi:hypothetical protein